MIKVKQIDVARLVSVERSTVTRILNNAPGYSYDKSTKQAVFKAAAQIGYLHPSVVKPQRRADDRKKLKAKALIKVYLKDGSFCSKCQGEVLNISSTGMLLRLLGGKKKALLIPLEPFYLEIDLPGSRLQVQKLKALPVRFARKRNRLGLGVQFFDPIKPEQLRKLAS